jgi:hypothetical protein
MTSRFEDRLWHELLERHGAFLAQPSVGFVPLPARGRVAPRLRLGPLSGAAGAPAAIISAGAIGLSGGGGGASPAYAITDNPDGSVTVTIRELAATSALNGALVSMRLPVRAVAVEASCTIGAGHYRQLPLTGAGPTPLYRPFMQAGVTGMRLEPSRVPPGDTLLLGVRELSTGTLALEVALYRGGTPPCLALPSSP